MNLDDDERNAIYEVFLGTKPCEDYIALGSLLSRGLIEPGNGTRRSRYKLTEQGLCVLSNLKEEVSE